MSSGETTLDVSQRDKEIVPGRQDCYTEVPIQLGFARVLLGTTWHMAAGDRRAAVFFG